MAASESWNSPDIVPSIAYSDLRKTVEWFERVFGFRERVEARLSWTGGGTTWMEVGSGLFNIATPNGLGSATVTGIGVVMKIYVDDVDQHCSRAQAQGAKIISAPEDGFWGGRIYRALDHEGHVWEISQRGCGLAADRWQLPSGVTRGVVK
jgi:uncharacterized glyoxalase superfamily protein PhnB